MIYKNDVTILSHLKTTWIETYYLKKSIYSLEIAAIKIEKFIYEDNKMAGILYKVRYLSMSCSIASLYQDSGAQ